MKSRVTPEQLRLAADIVGTGHPWQRRVRGGEWRTTGCAPAQALAAGDDIRIVFPNPPPGEEFHNPHNLTPEQVGAGYRLILKSQVGGENMGGENKKGTEECWLPGIGWKRVSMSSIRFHSSDTYRVPLNTPWPERPDPYADLKKAQAEGKVIQRELYNKGSGIWKYYTLRDGESLPVDRLRIKPEPRIVDLGPEDVTPYTRFRSTRQGNPRHTVWVTPVAVNTTGVCMGSISHTVRWAALRDYERNDSLASGKWDPNAWEPCHKTVE